MLASIVQRDNFICASVAPRLAEPPMLTRNTPPLTVYPEMVETIVLSSMVMLSPDVCIAARLTLLALAPVKVWTRFMCVKTEVGAAVIPTPYPCFVNVAAVVMFTSPTQTLP